MSTHYYCLNTIVSLLSCLVHFVFHSALSSNFTKLFGYMHSSVILKISHSSNILFTYLFFAVLGFELRAFTLSHSASPFLCWVFLRYGLENYLPRLALNHNPDLCLLSS
jgi:hypothetical protein